MSDPPLEDADLFASTTSHAKHELSQKLLMISRIQTWLGLVHLADFDQSHHPGLFMPNSALNLGYVLHNQQSNLLNQTWRYF